MSRPTVVDRCCCGHYFDDHKARGPHGCTECVCVAFQRPLKGGWRTSSAPPDAVHLASLKEGQRARRAALASIGEEP